ncbi:uncharacterized protein LOC115050188 [Echeneis naucrates]|uniref:uncharacterized protein LOC115050188 n=1 Tax=Echeneis naucrates TaxID=173247 RepID=UPI001113BF0A|nr:uncharacterized protein LOC115050188 [Echeneis naucrates]XP_029368838.1 uncharacterized protein LOC115050188 [Echeneis naucrates]
MIILWIALLLHQGYALISVATVHLGEPVTFKCALPSSEHSNTRVKWYKQSFGDTLRLITSLMKGTINPTFEEGFPHSRFHVDHTATTSALTIHSTVREDEALYHCAVTTWHMDQWNGTYLSLKENSSRMSGYTVVQLPAVSDEVHPGESVTLRCLVLSGLEKSSCADDQDVHWFGVTSDNFLPNVLYSNRKKTDQCDKQSVSPSTKSCIYKFSMNLSSSDAGIYYCAVVSCGEILFGNGTKVDIGGNKWWSFDALWKDSMSPFLLVAVSSACLMVIAFLIYVIKKSMWDHANDAVSLQEDIENMNLMRDEDKWVYSTAVFTMMKPGNSGTRGTNAHDGEKTYAAIKAFGFE